MLHPSRRAEPAWLVRRRAIEADAAAVSEPSPEAGLAARLIRLLEPIARRSPFWRVGVRAALNVRVRGLEVRVAGLPEAFSGYRILHLTDLHQ